MRHKFETASSKRGLCMEAVRAITPGKDFSARGNGLYLRPIYGKLSIDALHDMVSQLAVHCRCGACFTCLQATGYIE